MTLKTIRQLLKFNRKEELEDASIIFGYFKIAKKLIGKRQYQEAWRVAYKSIVGFYEYPRLGYPRYTHNKSHSIIWSKEARDDYFSGKDISNKVILEHMIPTRFKAEKLMALIGISVKTPKDMLQWLDENYADVVVAVISKREDKLIPGNLKQSMPDDGDAWTRYKLSGIDVSGFLPLTEDTRYAAQVSARVVNNGKKSGKVK